MTRALSLDIRLDLETRIFEVSACTIRTRTHTCLVFEVSTFVPQDPERWAVFGVFAEPPCTLRGQKFAARLEAIS